MVTTKEERIYREGKEEFYALIDALPQLIWVIRPDGSVVYTNQSWRDYSGWPTPYSCESEHHRLNGQQPVLDRLHTRCHANMLSNYAFWPQNLHPEDREHDLMLRRQAFATGEPYSVEYRLRDGRSGAYRWFLAQVAPHRNEAGDILLWMVSCTNIDDQKQKEERLHHSQECVDLLLNSSIVGVTIAEGENFIDANDTFLHMTGYNRQDLREGRMNWRCMTPPEHLAHTHQAHQELETRNYMTPFEKEYICKDGSRLPVVIGAVTLPTNSSRHIAFVLDNSARKELEQRKDTFLGMVSHELKTRSRL
ncbi:PAS domain-containing protein [Dictyobacter kobayashii]|uniref:histidine kinase n=1 Tax=Dictyobacter kobayashii TaxID=2014872 RepID=A0A402AKR5_9CHLR|nr:PAS domain S-box protein [Dictyobacter kobayashii]GCE19712.1 hypothetical protein KDK_35120 [Dictyobacter kobayashii]